MKKFMSLFLVLMMFVGVLSSCSIFGGREEESLGDSETDSEGQSQSESQNNNNNDNNNDNNDDNNNDDGDNDGDDDPEAPLVGTTYPLNSTAGFVKLLDPRMEKKSDYITCDWSASGIEFVATCKGDVVFKVKADTKMGGGVHGCYFRVYVDGAEYKNGSSPYYEVNDESYITVKGLSEGTHTIKLVKATGYTLANVNLISVTLDGTVTETAPANKELFIEYVGDSMSCGWGVVGNYDGAYTDQDAALAYPYLVSEALGADMSVVALSGQGIIKGNPGIANGYKFASPFRSKAAEYSFTRKPDVIVINADTNDGYENTASATYLSAFGQFIGYVREKNPDAHVVIVCNMMRTNYTTVLEDYVYNTLGGDDNNYYYYKAAETADVHTNHPSKEEHAAYATALTALIDSILKGTYDDGEEPPATEEYVPNEPTTTLPTDFETVYEQNFDNVTDAASAGITGLENGNLNPDFTNGKLNISSAIDWADSRAVLVPNSVFANSDYASKYLVEMDVTIGQKLGVFGLVFNTCKAADWNGRVGAHLVTLRPGTYISGDLLADSDIGFRAGYFISTEKDGQKTPTSNDVDAFDVTTDGEASFKLSIVVNQDRVDLFIDGVWVHGYNVPREVNTSLKQNSAIYLWNQLTDTSIDNLVVKVDASTKGSVEIVDIPDPDDSIPTNKTQIYTQNFDSATDAASAGVSNIYLTSNSLNVVDGKLSVHDQSWIGAEGGGYHWSLVGPDALADNKNYVLDMDVTINGKLGSFALYLNNKTLNANAKISDNRPNGAVISFRGAADGSTTTKNGAIANGDDMLLQFITFDGTGGGQTPVKTVKAADITGDSISFGLTVVVNSTYAGGCHVSVYVNDTFVDSYTYDNAADLTTGNGIVLWAQNTPSTIDNLTVSKF